MVQFSRNSMKLEAVLTCHVLTARSVPDEKLEYSMSSSPE
jgi:hypothetical protein